jgi:hypothetical protein
VLPGGLPEFQKEFQEGDNPITDRDKTFDLGEGRLIPVFMGGALGLSAQLTHLPSGRRLPHAVDLRSQGSTGGIIASILLTKYNNKVLYIKLLTRGGGLISRKRRYRLV